MRALLDVLLLLAAASARQGERQQPLTLTGHTGWVGAVAFSPDGKTLASAGADGTIRFWDPARGELRQTRQASKDPVCALAFAPDGKALAAAGFDHVVKVWDLATPGKARAFRGHAGVVMSVAFSPDGKALASGSVDGTVRLWDVDGGDPALTIRRHTSWVNAVAFAPNGALATGGSDGRVNVWVARGQDWILHATATAREGEIRSVALSPDGKTLAAGTRYGTVRVWDIARGKLLTVLKGLPGDVWAVAFAPDGKTLASGAGDWDRPGEVRLYDTHTWARRATLPHTGEVLCVAFSPDGRRLAAGSWDRTIKVWNLTPAPR